jgi:hypothetical protein
MKALNEHLHGPQRLSLRRMFRQHLQWNLGCLG